MAGLYADVPGYRWDLANDGTRLFSYRMNDWSAPVEYSPSQISAINGLEPNSSLGFTVSQYWTGVFIFLFPEARDLRGIYWQFSRGGGTSVLTPTAQYSLDTTDGKNGTWANLTPHGSAFVAGANPVPGYRSPALPSVNGVRGIRLMMQENNNNGNTPVNLHLVHMYGFRSQTVDRLAFWHPTDDVPIPPAHLDFADVARGSVTGVRSFRVKNLSATKTATGLQVSAAALLGSSFGAGAGLQVSTDGAAWGYSTSPITLAPGAVSPAMFARISLDVLAVPLSRSGRLSTSMTGWS